MELILEVLILLLLVRFSGAAAERLGQSASVGEMLAGIVLAAAAAALGGVVPFLDRLAHSEVLAYAANLGIFFLVLFAGVEMKPKEMAASSLGALAVAGGGTVLPLACGAGLAWLFFPDGEHRLAQALIIGVTIAVSNVPAIVKVLMDFGVLNQRLGQTVVTAAVFDDILGLLLLTILTSLLDGGAAPELGSVAWLLAKVGVFFAVTIVLGVHVYPHVSRRLAEMEAVALEFSALIAVALAYCLLADWLGLQWVLGPFMAGLFYEPGRVGKRVHADMVLMVGAIAGGVLGPLFFASVGLEVDLRTITAMPLFLILLIVVAMTTKAIGAGVPARLIGLAPRQALAVGTAMTARGGVGLVVLSIARERGFFGEGAGAEQLFSALALVIVVSTLATPMLLKRVLRSETTTRQA